MEPLSARELEILRLLWADGPLTAEAIVAALPRPADNSTVRTFLRILTAKGHVTHTRRGRAFVYRARTGFDKAARSALQELLDGYFDGSWEALLRWAGGRRTQGRATAGKQGSRPQRSAPSRRRRRAARKIREKHRVPVAPSEERPDVAAPSIAPEPEDTSEADTPPWLL